MSYQVLARKWRPRTFSEMVGQEHVVRALSNALDNDRLHHAYLFTGTRGVGKTTLARILAKSLNCEKGVSSTPCGECSICREVDEGRFADLLEVDAASRTKVDQTRELLENVPFAPIRGRYKVYLIDEVHMFSDSSFNALLKTLEEPPPHVKFLLATTDPQKVPVTVLSRCLQLNLKRLPVEQIQGQFEHILKAEGVEWEPAALALLARAADGSMRDGLSLLDQAIGFGGGAVREADVKAMLGIMAQDRLPLLMQAVASGEASKVLQLIAGMAEEAPDFSALLRDLLLLLHRTALVQSAPGIADSSWGDTAPIEALAQQFHPEEIQLFYEIALRGQKDLPLAPDPRSGFEMILLRMLVFRPEAGANQEETGPAETPEPARAAEDRQASPPERPSSPSAPEPATQEAAPAPQPTTGKASLEEWHRLLPELKLGGISAQLAAHCTVKSWDGRKLVLVLNPEGAALNASAMAANRLRESLEAWLGHSIGLEIEVGENQAETPAQKRAHESRQRQADAVQSMKDDPLVKALEGGFDGELIEESVKLTNK